MMRATPPATLFLSRVYRNTKALIALSSIIKAIGGGERSRSAVPSDIKNGNFFPRPGEMAALRYGSL